MNENVKKFLNALIMVAKFAEPTFVITKTNVNMQNTEHSVTFRYSIEGYCKETNKEIKVLSNGLIDGNKGMQIEVIKNGETRMFPFFGFNWKYLKLYCKM